MGDRRVSLPPYKKKNALPLCQILQLNPDNPAFIFKSTKGSLLPQGAVACQ